MKRLMMIVVVAAACGGGKTGPAKPGGDDPIAKCEGGDGKSCGQLGDKYRYGDTKNAPLAVSYLKKGCDLKYWQACSNLAHQYIMGEGVPQDEAKANSLYDLACDHDLGGACFSRALQHNRFLKDCDPIFHDPSTFKTPPECTGKRQFAEGKRAIELLRKGCRLKDDESCKVVALYEKGATNYDLHDDDLTENNWLLPGPKDTEARYGDD